MSIFNKILKLSSQIASSLLKHEEPKALDNSDLFAQEDKKYILDSLTNNEIIRKRAELIVQINKENDWERIRAVIDTKVKRLDFWKYAAAAAVLAFVSTIYISQNYKVVNSGHDKTVISKSVISPGTDKATLLLANGEVVVLGQGSGYNSKSIHSNGRQIVYNNDTSVKTAIQYNYLTVPRGGQFFIKLADGTKVWLNSESKLKFPVSFIDGKSREVELVYGEAYFDVSPSTAHKDSRFSVLTYKQHVEVMGTEFNIKAVQNENTIYTTLVEGKISLTNTISTKVLKPGNQSTLSLSNNSINIVNVDVYNEISWKEGVFSFKEKPLKEIMKVLSRWYDVEIVFTNPATEKITFNGILDKNQKIEDILSIISNTNKIPYEIKQKTIILK